MRARTQAQYDRWAALYDWLWPGYMRRSTSALAAALDVRSHERVLNVGCGTGALEARLLEAGTGASLVGVDVSEQMLERARAKLGDAADATFRQADAHTLPFPDAHFDHVVSASAFHYFAAPEAALVEMRRVLRPAGRLTVLDWSRDYGTTRLLDALLQRLDPAYHTCFTQAELHHMLHAAGYAVAHSRRFRMGLVWGMMLVEATLAE